MRVAYEGFPETNVSVQVTGAGRMLVPVALRAEAPVQLDAFVVTSEREGNAAALTRQKNADSVRNVIAMDALGVLANDNPAELLMRLPGIYSLPSDEGNLDRPTIRGLPATMNVTTIDGGTMVSQLLSTGVRWEESRTRTSGFVRRATLPAIADPVARTDAEYGREPVVRRGVNRSLFPSIHFRHTFLPNLIGRASWSTSIGRPALGDLVPTLSVSDAKHTVTLDNPSLKPQYADSYDLTIEYYLKPMGMISAGLFRKDLADFVFRQEMGVVGAGPDNGFGGQYAGYDIISNGNGGRGRVEGIEFSYLQQLTFLPGALRGLTVLLNYTHLRASGDYGQASAGTTGLVGFVPDAANVRLSYKYQWFAPYVQWSYTGRSLGNFAAEPQLQSHRLERRIANAGFSLRLPRNLEFFFDAANLFDESQRTTHYVSGNRLSTYYNGPFVSFGLNGRW